jgi:hypothetical protein
MVFDRCPNWSRHWAFYRSGLLQRVTTMKCTLLSTYRWHRVRNVTVQRSTTINLASDVLILWIYTKLRGTSSERGTDSLKPVHYDSGLYIMFAGPLLRDESTALGPTSQLDIKVARVGINSPITKPNS